MASVDDGMVGLPKGVEVYEGRKVHRGSAPGRLRPEKKPVKPAGGSGSQSTEKK